MFKPRPITVAVFSSHLFWSDFMPAPLFYTAGIAVCIALGY